jgi:WhiB family transcriptional regulator, redox-sensing transcriptional regulator
VSAAAGLGRRQAAILAHLQEHPGGRTATELARAFGVSNSLYKQLGRLEQLALVVGVPVWNPDQGRRVTRWQVAPPGTVPPPVPPADPARAARRLERDRKSQRARRARRNPPRRPGPRTVPPVLAGAACKGEDPELFFGPSAEFVTTRQQREAKAKAICARCPVRAECLEFALDTREAYGVWGGTSEDERRAVLRQRRRAS